MGFIQLMIKDDCSSTIGTSVEYGGFSLQVCQLFQYYNGMGSIAELFVVEQQWGFNTMGIPFLSCS